ncbi:MAG: HAMP domain-containing histidine kinase [Fibrobacter sp.]|nr:HAMP domain-containing histidine kinase [Fibrobacter sp.]
MKKKGKTPSLLPSLPAKKRSKAGFIKPLKAIVADLALYFVINVIWVHVMVLLINDPIVTMVGALWVGIIAYRGGVVAGLLGCLVVTASNYVAIAFTSGAELEVPYYFNNKMPGFVLGFIQCLVAALVVGYISQLIHQLRKEILLRKKIQKDLEEKVAELDAFGHTVAHDLKNPLMIINISIDGLIKEIGSDTTVKAKKLLDFISDGTKQMINIIESILMLAGVKKINPREFAAFPMCECVNDALNRMKYNIENNGVVIKRAEQWPEVFGYAPWITEVWANYISNAIKYGKNKDSNIKPVIEIGYDVQMNRTEMDQRYTRFWVRDNGDGIEKEKIPTLFKEFSRLHTTENGYGLGLSIVKSIVDKFGGKAGVESEPGKGSLFYFSLPASESKGK